MFVTIHTAPQVAQDLVENRETHPHTKEITQILDGMGLKLEQLYPEETDESLASQFSIEAPTKEVALEVSALLLNSGCVNAAYVKPLDAAP